MLLAMQSYLSEHIGRIEASLPSDNRTARPAAASATPTACILRNAPADAAPAATAPSAELPQTASSTATATAPSAIQPAAVSAMLNASANSAIGATLRLSAEPQNSVAA